MFRRIVLLGMLLPGPIFTGRAQEGYLCRSARLAELADAVHPAVVFTECDTCYTAGSCRELPVTAEMRNGVITHLGIRLFDSAFKKAAGKELCDFAERYLLEQLVATEEERAILSAEDGVQIEGDLRQTVAAGGEARFAIDQTLGESYWLTWRLHDEELFSIRFPACWELVSGENKIELENGFKRKLIDFRDPTPLPAVDEARLEKTTTRDVLVFKRGFYMIPQMESALYYRMGSNGPELLRERGHAAETLVNLLSVPALGAGCTVELTQQLYGFRSETYDAPLDRLIGFCLASGCRPYVGIEESDEERIVATLLMVNAEWGYNHIFRIVLDREQLDRETPRLQAALNVYAPTHNLENLYDDERQTRPHGKEAPKIKIP